MAREAWGTGGTLLQQLGGLLQGYVVGDLMIVEIFFVLANRDGLEKEDFAIHVNVEKHNVPVSCTHVAIIDVESPAFVEMAQQTATELDLSREAAVDFDEALAVAVDQQSANHVMKYFVRVCGWMKVRIWREGELYRGAFLPFFAKNEGIGQHVHHGDFLVLVLLALLLILLDSSMVAQEFLDAVIFDFELLSREGLTVDGEDAVDLAVAGVNDVEQATRTTIIFLQLVVTPKGVIVLLPLNLVPDHVANQLLRALIIWWLRGRAGTDGIRLSGYHACDSEERSEGCNAKSHVRPFLVLFVRCPGKGHRPETKKRSRFDLSSLGLGRPRQMALEFLIMSGCLFLSLRSKLYGSLAADDCRRQERRSRQAAIRKGQRAA